MGCAQDPASSKTRLRALRKDRVARYLQRIQRRGDADKKWLAFLRNHREAIAAFDFFAVPTVSFQALYCFFVIEYGRGKILHCNVTRQPSADWVMQQLREAFEEAAPYRYTIPDRDSSFSADILALSRLNNLKHRTH